MGVRLSGAGARACQNILRTFGIGGDREKGGNKGGGEVKVGTRTGRSGKMGI
jgi:hypothetical protein